MYNVAYDTPNGINLYLLQGCDLKTAKAKLASFRSLYLDKYGKGKPYPNGKGTYPFRNVRIVSL